jgi:hypothetical protein
MMINSTRLAAGPMIRVQRMFTREFKILTALTLIHVPLGILVYSVGQLSVLHPIGVLSLGLYWAARADVKLERVALAIAYLIGAEVLWRMAQVPIWWEFGKYGALAIAVVALVRRNHFSIPALPLIYLIALIPGCLLTVSEFAPERARDIISSNMSGPVLLLVSCWFFSFVRFTPVQLRRVVFAIIVPLVSVAFATLFFTVTAEEIQFTGESNFATSGGFGPNQVSSLLGLGAFAAVFCFLAFRNATSYKIYFLLAALLFSMQSVMTFSRGGMYNAAGAILVVALVQFARPSEAAKRLLPLVGLVLVFVVLIFPALDNFTGGTLQARFEDTGGTNRGALVETDFYIFWENPVLGAGVGGAYDDRERFLGRKAMSHTEFTRLLSEHGIFGLFAVMALLAMVVTNFRQQTLLLGRAMVAGFALWCSLFMLNAGMRLAAPSFLLGLTFATLVTSNRQKTAIIARGGNAKYK